ncbi:MAG: lipid A-modifier LpxR family protein [Opitutales bacterium]
MSRKPWVYGLYAGFSLQVGPCDLTVTWQERSREYRGQDANLAFGSIAFSVVY